MQFGRVICDLNEYNQLKLEGNSKVRLGLKDFVKLQIRRVSCKFLIHANVELIL